MIALDGHNLTVDAVWKIAHGGEACALDPNARELMNQSRALVDKLAAEPRAIYGINTGFGPLSGKRVSPEDLKQHQLNLLHHLSVGQGPLFSKHETRAIMAARANALARGYSGIRPEVVDLLPACLNANILPEIPSEGSVGASGDLIPLAHMARLLVGLGHADMNGKRLAAVEALKKHNLTPAILECKEGLALVNGTSVMTALAALAVREASALLGWMEVLTASLFQALFASPEPLCEQLQRARGFRGQYVVAERIAEHLKTHPEYRDKIEKHAWGSHPKPVEPGVEIQDPYSIRCSPQALGAFQEALWHIEQVVARELNASTDNPLVFPKTESIIHGGNFYGQQISMVCDYLKIGLIKMALFSERQIERLVNWRYNLGLPPLLTGADPGLHSGLAGCQILATSLAAECRTLATPASIQTIPTNANNQDVVSMGAISAKMVCRILPMVWKLAALESLTLAQAADLREQNVMGGTYKALHDLIREVSPKLTIDRPLFEDIDQVRELLQQDSIQEQFLPPRPTSPQLSC